MGGVVVQPGVVLQDDFLRLRPVVLPDNVAVVTPWYRRTDESKRRSNLHAGRVCSLLRLVDRRSRPSCLPGMPSSLVKRRAVLMGWTMNEDELRAYAALLLEVGLGF